MKMAMFCNMMSLVPAVAKVAPVVRSCVSLCATHGHTCLLISVSAPECLLSRCPVEPSKAFAILRNHPNCFFVYDVRLLVATGRDWSISFFLSQADLG